VSEQRVGQRDAVAQRLLDPAVGQEHRAREARAGGLGLEQARDRAGQLGALAGTSRSAVDDRDDPVLGDAEGEQVGDHPHLGEDALHGRLADDHHRVGAADDEPSREVAFLEVDGPGLGLAVEFGLDVGDDGVEGPRQAGQGCLEGAGPQRHPVAGASQAEQQAVAACRHAEGQLLHGGAAGCERAVGLDEFLHAGDDHLRVVEHRLVGDPAQVGEEHVVGRARAGGEPLGQGDGDRGRADAAGAGDRDEPAPRALVVRAGGRLVHRGRDGADGLGHGGERLQQVLASEALGQDRRRAELDPVPCPLGGDDDGCRTDLAGEQQQVPVHPGDATLDQDGGERPAGGQARAELGAGHAPNELDRDGGGGRPAGDPREPLGPCTSQPRDDVALAHGWSAPSAGWSAVASDGTGWPCGSAGGGATTPPSGW
jgi:hypothetical protein